MGGAGGQSQCWLPIAVLVANHSVGRVRQAGLECGGISAHPCCLQQGACQHSTLAGSQLCGLHHGAALPALPRLSLRACLMGWRSLTCSALASCFCRFLTNTGAWDLGALLGVPGVAPGALVCARGAVRSPAALRAVQQPPPALASAPCRPHLQHHPYTHPHGPPPTPQQSAWRHPSTASVPGA